MDVDTFHINKDMKIFALGQAILEQQHSNFDLFGQKQRYMGRGPLVRSPEIERRTRGIFRLIRAYHLSDPWPWLLAVNSKV